MRSVDDKICAAVEASYYITPESPGLTYEELLSVMAKVDALKGEVDHALDGMLRSSIVDTQHGLAFREIPHRLNSTGFIFRFDGDPRDRKTAAHVQGHLKELARRHGINTPLAKVSAVVRDLVNEGYDEHQSRLSLYWLAWAGLLKIDRQTQDVSGTERLLSFGPLNAHDDEAPIERRPEFKKILGLVAAAVELRTPAVRARALLGELAELPAVPLSGDAQGVLDDVLLHFADTGEGRSLDDTVRHLQNAEAPTVALVQLEPRGLLHLRGDGTAIPSLIAIAKNPRNFTDLLLLSSDLMERALSLWTEKTTRPLIKGPMGLLRPSPADRTLERARATRQFEALLASLSYSPCLFPGSTTVVEIRDEVLTVKSLIGLLRHKTQVRVMTPTLMNTDEPIIPCVDESLTDRVVALLTAFPHAAHALRVRRKDRTPLEMADEYDVQYLLHALLVTHFADVRPEDPTPTRAGAAARVDFFLSEEGAIVEAKMTREGLEDKKVGEELIIDAHRYEARLDCHYLFCLVYDPDRRLRNPTAIVKDVERATSRLTVRVVVVH